LAVPGLTEASREGGTRKFEPEQGNGLVQQNSNLNRFKQMISIQKDKEQRYLLTQPAAEGGT
jgi:hypothetical protein